MNTNNMICITVFLMINFLISGVLSIDKFDQYIERFLYKVENIKSYTEDNDIFMRSQQHLTNIFQDTLRNETFRRHLQESVRTLRNEELTQSLSYGSNNTQCISDAAQLLDDFLHMEPYIFQVLDAAGKMPPGVSEGNINWMGDYTTCMKIESTSNFTGKYCSITFYVPALAKLFVQVLPSVGMCVPHSCDNVTLVNLLQIAMAPLIRQVIPVAASCVEEQPYYTGDYVAIVILSVIGLFILVGTMVDVIHRICNERGQAAVAWSTAEPSQVNADLDHMNYTTLDNAALVNNDIIDSGLISSRSFHDSSMDIEITTGWDRFKGGMKDILLSLSVIRNAERLLNTSTKSQGLAAINGIRFLSMSWVILGHSYVFTLSYLDNALELLSLAKRFTFQPIINGTYSVDSFFFLSGLLVAYLTLKELNKLDGKINWFYFYFHRFWRLTPAYMLCLMFFTTLYLHLFAGPLEVVMLESPSVHSCYSYWWTNLLYINNFIPDFQIQCFAWAWYLANDMQFFIISPIYIILLYRYRRVGLALLLLTAAFCVIFTTAMVYERDYSVIMTDLANPNKTVANSGYIYERPYYRIAPYVVGIFTGYLVYLYKGHLRLPKLVVAGGWGAAIAINMAVIYGLYGHYHNTTSPSRSVAAFYVGASRFAWSLGLSWMTFACVCGYGGPVNRFLSWSVWAPLGRLTYTAYLVHPMVIFWYTENHQRLFHLTDAFMVWYFLGNLVSSYFVAFVVSMLIEAPLIQLEKMIFKRTE